MYIRAPLSLSCCLTFVLSPIDNGTPLHPWVVSLVLASWTGSGILQVNYPSCTLGAVIRCNPCDVLLCGEEVWLSWCDSALQVLPVMYSITELSNLRTVKHCISVPGTPLFTYLPSTLLPLLCHHIFHHCVVCRRFDNQHFVVIR